MARASVGDDAMVQSYHRDGFVIIRELFTLAEISRLRHESELLVKRCDLIDQQNLRCRFQPKHDTGESLLETFDPVIDVSPVSREFAFADKLLELLSALYGEPACLFKDKLIFKQPGQKGYVLHQDWIAWPDFPQSFLTVLVPIDPATADNGCTEVFAGCHQQGSLVPQDGQFHPLDEQDFDSSRATLLELDPGDIAIFGGFTPHRSAPNKGPGWRRQLYLSYNSLSDGGDQRERHYSSFHNYMKQRAAIEGAHDVYFR